MKRDDLKSLLTRIMYPSGWIVLSGFLVIAVTMVYSFVFHHESDVLTYIGYVLSFYSLTVIVLWVIRHVKILKDRILGIVDDNYYGHLYLTDKHFKALVSLVISLLINIFFALMKLIMGILNHSLWLISFGLYYLILTITRFFLLKGIDIRNSGNNLKKEYHRYRASALTLLVLNISLNVMMVLAIVDHNTFTYPGYFIFIVALFAFFNLINAIINVFRYRRVGSPVLSASKIISFAQALISMLTLEMGMLSMYENDVNFSKTMLGISGACVAIIFLCVSVYMFIHATTELQKLKSENS
ncbi:MAG: hypothetical protein Q4D13_02280 [Erysipelotrichaceae bacterium]|nr:hypothetical protein [Erysipelotrichaceae bacterium]